jgi:hypothetical protein
MLQFRHLNGTLPGKDIRGESAHAGGHNYRTRIMEGYDVLADWTSDYNTQVPDPFRRKCLD